MGACFSSPDKASPANPAVGAASSAAASSTATTTTTTTSPAAPAGTSSSHPDGTKPDASGDTPLELKSIVLTPAATATAHANTAASSSSSSSSSAPPNRTSTAAVAAGTTTAAANASAAAHGSSRVPSTGGSRTPSTSTSTSTAQPAHTNSHINRMLKDDERRQAAQIKLLLLGAGECGKSTILKQMKILHRNGFTTDERATAIHTIYSNLLSSLQQLVRACDALQLPFEFADTPAIAAHISALLALSPTAEHLQLVHALWNDAGVRSALDRRSEFYLLDSAPYFLAHVDRILQPDYSPTNQDILRSRHATTGIIETEFIVNKVVFKMFDVGGQRGERKKWIHCFDSVHAILFVSSLNDYDQVLEEDRSRNRLVESLVLFEGIISLPWFRNAAIILFLNKDDLFKEKVVRVDISSYFPGYVGGLDYEEGLDFIKEMFFAKNNNPNRTIYAHVTDATDTAQFAFVWQAIRNTILEWNLQINDLR